MPIAVVGAAGGKRGFSQVCKRGFSGNCIEICGALKSRSLKIPIQARNCDATCENIIRAQIIGVSTRELTQQDEQRGENTHEVQIEHCAQTQVPQILGLPKYGVAAPHFVTILLPQPRRHTKYSKKRWPVDLLSEHCLMKRLFRRLAVE